MHSEASANLDNSVSALSLSQEDIRRLLEDSSSQTRVDITNKISGAYGSSTLHARELKVAEQIFRLLLRDTEVRVRAALASNIKESKIIPRDIVMVLARDVEDVALPVLEYSQVLTEEDMVDLVKTTRHLSRHLAISRRRKITEELSNALLGTKDSQVTSSLIANNGADISDYDMENIIEEYQENGSLMEALALRPRLPLAAVEKLMTVVSDSLASNLKQKYKFTDISGSNLSDLSIVDETAASSREKETLQIIKNVNDDNELDKLVAQMQGSNRLSPSMILGALCQGNFAFFEASLARMANIPIANARSLLNDQGDLGFRGLYNKSGLPEAMMPAIRLLFRVVHELVESGEKPGKSRFANRVVEKILSYSEENPIENLSYIIAMVRRSI